MKLSIKTIFIKFKALRPARQRALIGLAAAALLSSSAPALAFFDLFKSSEPAPAEKPLTVCSVPQYYEFLTSLQQVKAQSGIKFNFATATDLYAQIANNAGSCDVLLSASERFPVLLIRSQKAKPAGMSTFARAPLALYSADPQLFADGSLEPALKRQLKSLVLPKAELTPAGFAAASVVKSPRFPTNYLKHHLYRAEHEYQAYAMITSGNVQAGFVTLPLIAEPDGQINGSYALIPDDLYPPLYCYALILNGAQEDKAQQFVQQLTADAAAQQLLQRCGFEPLEPKL